MTVIVKSAPDTPDGRKGLQTAIDLGADVILLQNGVYFVLSGSAAVAGMQVYAMEEDCMMRGIRIPSDNSVRMIDYAELVDIMQMSDHVIGML